ncbi:MAG: hypothetical protein JWN40_5011 [Phycisphaerales bacterium]|nr:hypothetical protein [Phycisphaerales bacterium]
MSLKKTTRKRLLIVVCLCILLVAGSTGLYVVRKQRIHAQFMGWRAEGMQAAKQSENDKAVDLLGRYLRRYPEDVDVLVEYVRVRPMVKSPERQHLRDTMTALRHLLTLRPDLYDQRKALLKLYGDYGYASEAVVTADKLLESNLNDAEVVGIRANALARVRRIPEALAAAKNWAKLSPQEIDAHLLCFDMMHGNGSSNAEIAAYADGLRDKLHDDASFELVRGIAAAVGGAEGDARAWILKASAHPKTDLKVQRRIIASLDRLGEQEKSLELLKTLVKETGDSESQKTLVRRLWERNSWSEVLAYPVAKNSELSADLELKGMIGTSLARTGKKDEAGKVVAELLAAQQDVVAQAWGEMLSQSLSPGSIHPRKAVNACQAALNEAPGDPYIRYFLGQAYAAMGEPELATSAYRIAAQQNNTWAAPLIALAESYLSLDRQEQALDAASVAFNRSKNLGAVILTIALNAAIESGRRSDDAPLGQLLDGIEASPGAAPYVLPERVAWLARANRIAEATAAVEKGLAAKTPLDEGVLRRLASVSRVKKLSVEAACYAALERQSGPSASLALSKSVSVLLGGKADEAITEFMEARKGAGKDADLQWQIAGARLLDFARDPKATAEWVRLGDAYPDDLLLQESVLAARTPRSDRDFMARTIDRVRRLSADEGVQWRIAKARWLLDDPANTLSAAEAASVLLIEALRVAPDAIEGRFLQAKALDRQGNASAAAEQVMTVLRLNPAMSSAALYLAQLLQARGDFAGAREYLDRVTRNPLKDDSSRRWAAQLLARQGNPDQAIKLLEESADAEGGSDLMLAMLYRQRNDLVRAEQLCAKLLQKPDLPSITLAIEVYGAMGRPEDVKRAASLLKVIKVEPGIEELLLAEYAGRTGKLDEALQLSTLATVKAPQNGSTWKSLFIFSLAAGKTAEAWASVEQGLKAVPNNPYLIAVSDARSQIMAGIANPNLAALSASLTRSPEVGGSKEAIQIMATPVSVENSRELQLGRLLQVANQYPLNLTLQLFAIARLLSEGNRNDEAATMAMRATQSFPSSADAARMAATALMNAKRWNETLSFAKVWRERSPNSPVEADRTAAIALLKTDQAPAARDLLAPYIAKATEQPAKNSDLITLYAAALLRSGENERVETLLLPLLRGNETIRSAWLARAQEDLSLVDQVNWTGRIAQMTAENSLSGQIHLAGVSTALGNESNNEQLLATARKIRADLAARTDLPAQAMAVLGSQAEQDHDLPAAEALYRRALAADSNLIVIKNNLAMLLAGQGRNLEEAMALANQAILASPATPNFYDTLAAVQDKAGKVDQAVETLRKAIRLDPGHLDWQINLATLLVSRDRKAEANKVLAEIDADGSRKTRLTKELKAKLNNVREKISSESDASLPGGK